MALACNFLSPNSPVVAHLELVSKSGLKCPSSSTAAVGGVTSQTRIPSFHGRATYEKGVKATTMFQVTEAKLGGSAGGAGVLERPGLDQSSPDTAPRTEEGGEMGKLKQRLRNGGGDRYRVLLVDHERHTEAQVATIIPRVVPTVTAEDARKCFYESREFGVGLVTVAVKEHAEFYAQMLTRNGLRCSIEQDSSVA